MLVQLDDEERFFRKWNEMKMEIKMRNCEGQQKEDRVSHMISGDNCYLFAESKKKIGKMIVDTIEEQKKRGLDWKVDQMEMISWGFREQVGDLLTGAGGKNFLIQEVEAIQALGALITRKVDSMKAMKFRMSKAIEASWMDMKLYKNKGIAEGRKHKRYREVVQSCILHSCEGWSWNKEMVDALHGWESRNWDLMSSRRWAQTGLSLEWFWANQIRKARQRFVEGEKH